MKLAVMVSLMTLLLIQPATADAHVVPDSWSPGVQVHVERGSAGKPARSAQTSALSKPTPSPLKYHCFPDQLEPGTRCAVRDFPDDKPKAKRDLTPGDVLLAVREIGLPSLRVQIQPGEQTLVNIPTIFYATPTPFERSVDLLGYDIDVVADPVSFRWLHGDGTIATTQKPGRPYPAMDVTYRYQDAAENLQARVDVTYQVRYRIDGGAWQTIDQTLTAAGPMTGLDVKEAAPVLTSP